MYAGTSGFSFLQNIVDGSQPIAISNSIDKSVEFFGDLDIPNFYNKKWNWYIVWKYRFK